jgi:hypothetical protein
MELLDEAQRKRLKALQADAAEAVDSWRLEKLTLPDLLLLLRHDPALRQLLRGVWRDVQTEAALSPVPEAPVAPPVPAAPSPVAKPLVAVRPIAAAAADAQARSTHTVVPAATGPAGVAVAEAEPAEPVTDPLRGQLAPELALLQLLRADAGLAQDWLGDSLHTEGQQLVRVLVLAAQWDMVLQLWDTLAGRCKAQQGAASAHELGLLRGVLAIHNLRWQNRQAQLLECRPGEDYDYRRMQRANPSGERVLAQWLPGLMNAGGEPQKLPLVQTAGTRVPHI